LLADISCVFTINTANVMTYKEMVNRLWCVKLTGRIITVIWL